MATNIENPAPIIERQGQETDATQQTRLEKGIDVVYAHLATLATAAAFNGIEWGVEDVRKRGSVLVAVRRQQGKKDQLMEKNSAQNLVSHLPVEDKSRLTAKIKLAGSYITTYQSIPNGRAIDSSLEKRSKSTRQTGGFNTYLDSSEVLLERPNQVHNAEPMKLGIKAKHSDSVKDYTYVSLTKDVAQPEEFQDIAALLTPTFNEVADRGSTDLDRARIRMYPERNITHLATAHFDFHEALGIPERYVDLGRKNFTTLVAYTGLPYRLDQAVEPTEAAHPETEVTEQV